MLAISEIKKQFQVEEEADICRLIEEYQTDERAGVQKLVDSARKKLERRNQERQRMEQMKRYEREYEEYTYIAGMDEVGRGPLAGPVVTCAVILPKDCDLLYINDSKKVSAKLREKLCGEIKEVALDYQIGMADHTVIDEINILQATYKAMRDCVSGMQVQPDLLLNDAVTVPGISIPQVPIVKGDAKSISIAAASIVAKVTRDAMMEQYDKLYPEYDFASNKGYGSAKHIEAIKKYGPCPIHRRTFIQNFL
ncbi:MAG: ribonuclease HII [Lachnospiraceae bacterium]|nr:ribonuclease HII [Lachnospiraceae bacterium]